MTPENKILRDLAAGQSTADSIAGRIGIHTAAATAILARLVKSGVVIAAPLSSLTIYRLVNPTQ